jgi:hypothetical protein
VFSFENENKFSFSVEPTQGKRISSVYLLEEGKRERRKCTIYFEINAHRDGSQVLN